MLELMGSLVALAAVLCGAYWLWRITKIPAGVAPFAVLCFVMLFLSLAGCCGMLSAAVWLLYGGAAVGVATLIVLKLREGLRTFSTPSVLMFAVAGVALLVFFAMRQPMFATWDEFSFWGTAAKIVKNDGELYVTAEIGWAWVPTHRPALIMLGYFFQFFGAYSEWRIYAAYAIFILAVILAVVAGVTKGTWQIALPVGVVTALTPAVFTVYAQVFQRSEVYCTTLADVPMGLVLGAALALHFGQAYQARRQLWVSVLALCLLCLIKDTGFALALVALALIAGDLFLEWGLERKKHRLWPRLVFVIISAVLICCTFFLWTFYLGSVSEADTSNVGGLEQMSMVEMVVQGLKETFIPSQRSEKFTLLMRQLVNAICTVRATMLGSGLMVMVIIVGLLVLGVIASGSKTLRLRTILYAVLGCAGYVVYVLFIGFTYVYVFKDVISADLTGYERYLYPYYVGFFLGALALFVQSALENRFLQMGRLVLCLSCVGLLLRTSQFLTPELTVLNQNPTFQWQRIQYAEQIKWVKQQIEPDSRVFFISQGDNGNSWFVNSYEFYPYILDYSFGGGTLALPGLLPDDTMYYIALTQEELLTYLTKNQCDYVYVECSNDVLRESYGSLFSDGLKGDGIALYRVAEDGNSLQLIKRNG